VSRLLLIVVILVVLQIFGEVGLPCGFLNVEQVLSKFITPITGLGQSMRPCFRVHLLFPLFLYPPS